MQALEKLWQQLTAALGAPALILVASAFILVEFLDALIKVTEKSAVVSLPAVILFSLGALFALGFVIRNHYGVDVPRALRHSALAGAAGSLIGALVYAFQLTPADNVADAFARYVVFGWPLAVCYGFALSLLDPPEFATPSSPVGAASERFNWRARVTAVAVFLATIVLPPAAVVARFVVEWPVSFVSTESIVMGLGVFLCIKGYLRLRTGDRGGRVVLLVAALAVTGIVVRDARGELLPSMPFLFSIPEAVPLAMLSITLLLVVLTLVYMLAVVGPLRWMVRTLIVALVLLVGARYPAVPLVGDSDDDCAQLVARQNDTLDPDAALVRARDCVEPTRRADALKSVAEVLMKQDRWTNAEQVIREAIATRETLRPSGEEAIAGDRVVLAGALTMRAEYRQAEQLLRQVVATRAASYNSMPSPTKKLNWLASRRALASSLVEQEQYEGAYALMRSDHEEFRRITRPSLGAIFSASTWRAFEAGEDRRRLEEYVRHLVLYGRVAREMSLNADAEDFLKRALRIGELFTARMEPSRVDIATIHARLGRLYFVTGRLDEADAELHRSLAANPGRIVAAVTKAYMADLRSAQQRFDQAEALYREADQLLQATLHPGHPYHLLVLPGLAKVSAERGAYVRAFALIARAQVLAAGTYGPDARQTAAIEDVCYDIVAVRDRAERADPVAGAERKATASTLDFSPAVRRLCQLGGRSGAERPQR